MVCCWINVKGLGVLFMLDGKMEHEMGSLVQQLHATVLQVLQGTMVFQPSPVVMR